MRSLRPVVFVSVLLVAPVTGDTQPAASQSVARGRLVEVAQDLRLYLDCIGEGAPTVVIDGGAGAWSIHYRRIQDEVAGFTRVCTYDRAGLGASDPSTAPRRSSVMADELHRLLHAAGEEGPFLLAGHSLGGYNVRVYQRRYAPDVAGLVLLESAHELQWDRLPGAWDAVEAQLPAMRAYAAAVRRGEIGLQDMPPWPEAMSAEVRADYEAAVVNPVVHETTAEEFANARLSAGEVPRGGIGDLPLIVASEVSSFEAFRGTGLDVEGSNQVWAELQADLATLAPSAVHLLSEAGDHNMARTDPEFAAAAIREGMRIVRRDGASADPELPSSREWLHRLPEASDHAWLDEVLSELEASYRSRDAATFVQFFSTDFEQLDVGRRVRVRGRPAWWEQTERVNAAHEWMERLHHGRKWLGNAMLVVEIEWAGRVRAEALAGSAADYRYTGLGLLEFDDDRRIKRQLLFGDIATLDGDLGVASPPAWQLMGGTAAGPAETSSSSAKRSVAPIRSPVVVACTSSRLSKIG
jgi:pimeloyl-ACP methyl ester carboxylesterase